MCVGVFVKVHLFIFKQSGKSIIQADKKKKKTKWVRLAKKCPRLHVVLFARVVEGPVCSEVNYCHFPLQKIETTIKIFFIFNIL